MKVFEVLQNAEPRPADLILPPQLKMNWAYRQLFGYVVASTCAQVMSVPPQRGKL